MSNGFDAYHKWLSIPPQDQPPNHYRLLGLGLFESDPDVVAAAADRQMAHVQTYKTGPHSALSQKLLNEISAAKLCLLRPQKKAAYDEQLRRQLADSPAGANGAPPGAAAPSVAARGSAMAGTASAGRPFPGYAGGPVAPPPPALPPPVADAPHAVLGTMSVLIGAGVIAVLLLIGIIVVLSRTSRPPVSPAEKSAIAKTGVEPAASTSNAGEQSEKGSGSAPIVQPPTAVIPPNPSSHTLPPQNPPQVSKTPVATSGQTGSTATPPKATGFNGNPFGPPTNVEPVPKSPKPKTGNEVATTGLPEKHTTGNTTTAPPEKSPFDTNPPKTGPANGPSIKPPADPALAGKAAVPDKAAIAAIEQRLGNTDASSADLLDQAHKSVDAAEIYVLLQRALAAAVKQGDAATAISTVDELARRFAVNSLELRTQTLDDLKLQISTPEAWDALASAAAALFEDSAAAAKPAAREHLEELSLACARRSANLDTIRKITIRIVRARGGAVPAPKPVEQPAPNPAAPNQ